MQLAVYIIWYLFTRFQTRLNALDFHAATLKFRVTKIERSFWQHVLFEA